jgi:hypothetical protein
MNASRWNRHKEIYLMNLNPKSWKSLPGVRRNRYARCLRRLKCVTPSSGCRLRELAQALSVAALKYPENVPVPGGHPRLNRPKILVLNLGGRAMFHWSEIRCAFAFADTPDER